MIPVYPDPPVEVRRHLPDGHPVRLPTIKVVGAVAGAEDYDVEAVPSRTGLFGKKIICRLLPDDNGGEGNRFTFYNAWKIN